MNGNGYKTKESNNGKDIALALITNPIDEVTLAVGYMAEDVALSSFQLDGLVKKLTAMGAYKFSDPLSGLVFVESASQQDSKEGGYSVGGQAEILDKTNLFGRYDSFNHGGADYIANIVGVEYNWGSNVKLAIDYQADTKNGADNSDKIYLHTRVKW